MPPRRRETKDAVWVLQQACGLEALVDDHAPITHHPKSARHRRVHLPGPGPNEHDVALPTAGGKIDHLRRLAGGHMRGEADHPEERHAAPVLLVELFEGHAASRHGSITPRPK
jgi:hypothetical protein